MTVTKNPPPAPPAASRAPGATPGPDAPGASSARPASARATILLVDDIPENLRVLAEMLLQSGYSPRPVTSGAAALKLLEKIDVDLILLDINMPEMNGFELCSKLKDDARYRDIPVLFLSAADDTAHKVEAFQRGGVDYIGKPFQFEEVKARVDTHLGIRRLQREQESLLERTLGGAVHTLMECLELASPQVFVRASMVRDCVHHLVGHLPFEEPWSLRIAGSLAFVGCLALPEDVTQAVFAKEQHSHETEHAFRRHAQVGADLVADVPRLERVAAMIRAQYDDDQAGGDAHALLGARMLRVVQRYCQARFEGHPVAHTLAALRKAYPWAASWLPVLQAFRPVQRVDVPLEGPISKLPIGARVLTDVRTVDGRLLLGEGQEVSKMLWMRLAEYVKGQRVENHFVFQVPSGGEA